MTSSIGRERWSTRSSSIFKHTLSKLRIETHMLSHVIPLLIKPLTIRLLHASVMILTSHISLIILFDNFSTLIIEHSFMSSFLNASSFIFIHLLPFYQTVSTTDLAMSFGLINLIAFLMVSFFDELSFPKRPAIQIAHSHGHITPHLVHHFINLTEH